MKMSDDLKAQMQDELRGVIQAWFEKTLESSADAVAACPVYCR